jgi:predicted glycosyltransferase
MAYSSMFVGDSQTMTSEAAILGVPALKCNTFAGRLSVPNMLEDKYGLCYAYLPERFEDMLAQIRHLLDMPSESLHAEWQAKRQRMLHEMIDPTEFFINHIEQNETLS